MLDEADDAVVNTQTQQHLAYAATLVETRTQPRLWSKELFAHTRSWPCHSNNLDTRIDFKTTNPAGSLTVIRDGSAEFKGAEKACIYFGGITPQDGFQIVPSDSASQVGARLGKKFEHYPTCPALPSHALIHIWKVKRNPLFERKVIDLP